MNQTQYIIRSKALPISVTWLFTDVLAYPVTDSAWDEAKKRLFSAHDAPRNSVILTNIKQPKHSVHFESGVNPQWVKKEPTLCIWSISFHLSWTITKKPVITRITRTLQGSQTFGISFALFNTTCAVCSFDATTTKNICCGAGKDTRDILHLECH